VSHPRRSHRSREEINGVRLKITGLSDGAPDCPVSQRSTAPTVGRANPRVTRGRANGLMGAPDCPVCTGQCPVRQRLQIFNVRLRQFRKVICTDSEQCLSGGAPDCPVRHTTEGKDCFPRLFPTAPSCLGAIKGTPRRWEEYTKHTLIILNHSHSVFAHSIDILSELSSVLVVNFVLFI
jgi:hypothetical protein